jgi:hypothetical protein
VIPFPLPLGLVPGWLIAAVTVFVVTTGVGLLVDNRMVGRLPKDTVAELEQVALTDEHERDRFAVSTGWASVHDFFSNPINRRALSRWAGADQRVAAAKIAVSVEAGRARTALQNLCVAEQGQTWRDRPPLGPKLAALAIFGMALPGDLMLTFAAVQNGETTIDQRNAVPLAIALSALLFLSAKLLATTALARPLRFGQLTASLGGVLLGVALVASSRPHGRVRWAAFAMVPTVVTAVVTCLSHSPDELWARTVERQWKRRWRALRKALRQYERRSVPAARSRVLVLGRASGLVVAVDHLARAGRPADAYTHAAALLTADDTLRRLGVVDGHDELLSAKRMVDELANAFESDNWTQATERTRA